ncbi:MAG: hypothetical protein AVDCRST_MAG19-4835 [uncultured Thermomicrobiales bacterium]|uniref:Uncharacterized protein n=1 Tax=uncultured Thermomicrobiales bacterium TaxID=1645740 RepID=A0A6J4VS99_9BACT|nr:MAG: hypothetical protein AVDCRST_MAG19-4835 [uncultured Thermomicrobiales bacterium]
MEVVPPSDTRAGIEAKVALSSGEKVPLVLVVYARRRTVRVRTPENGDRNF